MTTQPRHERIDDALDRAKALLDEARTEAVAQGLRLRKTERALEYIRAERPAQDKRSGGVVIGVRDNNRTEQLLKDILTRLDTLVEAQQAVAEEAQATA